MRIILVVDRRHLFPGLSPQGFLPPASVDLQAIAPHCFFAERAYMEACSHFKQIIPYLILTRGQDRERRVLAYQRRNTHSEQRLGGLWSVGFGGHIEPLDRAGETNSDSQASRIGRTGRSNCSGSPTREDRTMATASLVQAAAMRELIEETGLDPGKPCLEHVGYINSDREDVSSVHFGVVFRVALDEMPGSDEDLLARVSAQAEPHQARWLPLDVLENLLNPGAGPDKGTFEDWSCHVIHGGSLASS